MPHVIVKLWPGRTEEQKKNLADAIVKDMMSTLGASEGSISIAFEEVKREDWTKAVYEPDIAPNLERLYKKPGYQPE